MAGISNIHFWKKAQNRRFLGSPTSKIFFDKLSIKKLRHTKNFGRDPPHRHFRAYCRKSVFQILFLKMKQILGFWAIYSRNLRKIMIKVFSKKGHKIAMFEEAPDRNFWWPINHLSKFCGKTFLRSETPFWWFGDFISRIESRNLKKTCHSASKLDFSNAFLGKLQQKSVKKKSEKRFFENRP